jgi:hypothetical protein
LATAQTIIDRALRLIGAIASGESPTTAESNDGLTALNAMISSWQTEKLNVYAFVDTSFNLAAADNSYTVGPAGNFALTPRPQKIEQVFVTANGINYEVELIDYEKWNRIPDQTSDSDIPVYAYYEPTLTTGTLKLWPVPNTVYALHIITWTSLAELAAVGTSVSLPQGYERALAYNLAIELAPEYGSEPSQSVVAVAMDSKASIKRANQRPMLATPDLWGAVSGQRSNIYAGGYIA